MKRTAKRRTRGTITTTTPRPSIAEIWRKAFSYETSTRISDTIVALAEWRDRLPAARKRKLIAAWDDVVAGLADVMTRQAVASSRGKVAIQGVPPRGIAASTTRSRIA